MISKLLQINKNRQIDFLFNLSVGYDLEGIKSPPVDKFIKEMCDASNNNYFLEYKSSLLKMLRSRDIKNNLTETFGLKAFDYNKLISSIESISSNISNSVTLSTMHGCPPAEIEAIASYLLEHKKLNTYIKLNPTLLGFDRVKEILSKLGYNYIKLDKSGFDKDLSLAEALPMIRRLKETAAANNLTFGIKLSNTLEVINTKEYLDDKRMYMSGRSLFPLTINLAGEIAQQLNGKIEISFSGGVSTKNISELLECGIFPVTVVTDLLKPGGYSRLTEMAKKIDSDFEGNKLDFTKIKLSSLNILSRASIDDSYYKKETREVDSVKVGTDLPLFDCFVAPCQVCLSNPPGCF